MSSQEEINEIFKKWEDLIYVPSAPTCDKDIPTYTPTPKEAGPKAISIEEYQRRHTKKKEDRKSILKTPKKRGGKKRRFQQTCRELQNIINISKGEQKRILISKLKKLKEEGWQQPK